MIRDLPSRRRTGVRLGALFPALSPARLLAIYLAVFLGLPLLGGCTGGPRSDPPTPVDSEPPAASVERVLFLVGDAGDLPLERAPLLHHLRAEVERWSGALARDSAVAVVFLGDNVYPEGVRDRGSAHFPADSARLHAQVWSVDGPRAREHGSFALFLAGNHDWGAGDGGPTGVARLRNQEAELLRHRAAGRRVSLVPEAGEPGPEVVPFGPARLVLLDTDFWLLEEGRHREEGALAALAAAIDSTTIVLGHHPLRSAGEHGGQGRSPLDPRWLLGRAGVLGQDLNAGPYRRFREGLTRAFAEARERPLVYAAGHEHSLQLLRGEDRDDPSWHLISGAGSKGARVGTMEGLEWSSEDAGFAVLLFLEGGGVLLRIEAAPREAGEAFATIHSIRLR